MTRILKFGNPHEYWILYVPHNLSIEAAFCVILFLTLVRPKCLGDGVFFFNNAKVNMENKTSGVFITCILLVLSLTGCAFSKEVFLPDGTKGHSISCDGAAVGINTCYEKAGELCGSKGYDQLSREGQVIPMGVGSSSISGSNTGFQGQSFVTYGAFNTKSIMIRCRN